LLNLTRTKINKEFYLQGVSNVLFNPRCIPKNSQLLIINGSIIPFFISLRFPKSYYTVPENSVKIHTHIYTRSYSCAGRMIQSTPCVHQHPKSWNSPFLNISCTSSIVPCASLVRQNLDIHMTNKLEILKHIISSMLEEILSC
jgi:hypothetical protein